MLRQVAVLLERENDKLHAKLQTLTAELARLRGDTRPAAELELEFLKELLAQRERALFGASSEQRPRPATAAPSPPPAVRPGHGPTAQPTLPIVDVVHELAEPDLTCPQCGGMLREMPGQTEDAEEITVVERRFVLLKHRRKKYRCACNGCVDTAPGHHPRLALEGQTLWDQIEALATVLAPTYDALRRYVLTAPVVGADETWWRLLGGPESKRWWAWSVTRDDAVTYTILESRSQDAARRVLDGYHGIVLADGYGAYAALARAGPGFTLAHCWAHVRRKFVEAEPHYPAPCAEILERIGQLYAVERACPGADLAASEETRAATLALRARLRREQSTPIVEAIRAWASQQRALPESSLGKAIAYMLGLWPGLTHCLDDARIPLDNNATERGLRGMVVGRKNHYGSRSKRGTEVAALFYSLIESAKLCGVEPKAYLLQATRAALENPGTVTLPHALLTP